MVVVVTSIYEIVSSQINKENCKLATWDRTNLSHKLNQVVSAKHYKPDKTIPAWAHNYASNKYIFSRQFVFLLH